MSDEARLAARLHHDPGGTDDRNAESPGPGGVPLAADLVAALDLRSSLTMAERNALVFALVRAHHASPHSLWQAVLLQASRPMLRRLRHAVRKVAGRDVEQQILLHFADAVVKTGATDDPDRIALRLLQLTAASLFEGLRRQAAAFYPDVPASTESKARAIRLPRKLARPFAHPRPTSAVQIRNRCVVAHPVHRRTVARARVSGDDEPSST